MSFEYNLSSEAGDIQVLYETLLELCYGNRKAWNMGTAIKFAISYNDRWLEIELKRRQRNNQKYKNKLNNIKQRKITEADKQEQKGRGCACGVATGHCFLTSYDHFREGPTVVSGVARQTLVGASVVPAHARDGKEVRVRVDFDVRARPQHGAVFLPLNRGRGVALDWTMKPRRAILNKRHSRWEQYGDRGTEVRA